MHPLRLLLPLTSFLLPFLPLLMLLPLPNTTPSKLLAEGRLMSVGPLATESSFRGMPSVPSAPQGACLGVPRGLSDRLPCTRARFERRLRHLVRDEGFGGHRAVV